MSRSTSTVLRKTPARLELLQAVADGKVAAVKSWDGGECDYSSGPAYSYPDGGVRCRCVICARCGHHTGNAHQGHYWALCRVSRRIEAFHLCCPDNCELYPSAALPPADLPLAQPPG